MSVATISFHLDRPNVSVEDFREALDEQIALVDEILAQMGAPRDAVRWVIAELHTGSAGGVFAAEVVKADVRDDTVRAAVVAAGEGMATLSTSSRATVRRPRYFTERAMRSARKLTELSTSPGSKKSILRFEAVAVIPSVELAANISVLVESTESAIGSIEGTLIGVRRTDRGYTVHVRDRLSGEDVRCMLQSYMRDEAIAAFERRVIVRGRILSTRDGKAEQIDVRGIEVIPDDAELPTSAQARGILRGREFGDE